MTQILALVTLAVIIAIIIYLGSGRFGRSQTQLWIDRFRSRPRLHAFLDRHHGKFRAGTHYIEFGGLYLVIYWVYDALLGPGDFRFHVIPAIVIAVLCVIAALLDELHQLRSGTRCFRRVDFLHSCCGIALAIAIVEYQDLLR